MGGTGSASRKRAMTEVVARFCPPLVPCLHWPRSQQLETAEWWHSQPHDNTNDWRTSGWANRRHSGPNDNTSRPNGQTMAWRAQPQREGPNDNMAGSMTTTTRTAQRQRERPNNKENGPVSTWRAQQQHERAQLRCKCPDNNANSATTTRRAERWHSGPNDSTEGQTQMWVALSCSRGGRFRSHENEGGDSEQSRAPLLFLYVYFNWFHVPRH